MLRNVDKAFKLAFVSLIRTESLAPHRSELIQAFGSIGGNVAMFQSRQSRQATAEESKRSAAKRAAAQQQEAEQQRREKRAKTEYVPIIPSASSQNILANYDITQIPPSAIATLCMTVLQTVPLEVMQQRLSMVKCCVEKVFEKKRESRYPDSLFCFNSFLLKVSHWLSREEDL